MSNLSHRFTDDVASEQFGRTVHERAEGMGRNASLVGAVAPTSYRGSIWRMSGLP